MSNYSQALTLCENFSIFFMAKVQVVILDSLRMMIIIFPGIMGESKIVKIIGGS